MADETEEIITAEDRELFHTIARHIKADPAKYQEAGKWLDEYTSENAYWQRKEQMLEKLQAQEKNFPNWFVTKERIDVEKEIEERRTLGLIIRFQEARNSLLEKYKEQEFIPQGDARRVVVVTWLLTDPDAERADLNITELEKWPWESKDDVSGNSREYAQILWRKCTYAHWMKLVRIAWAKICAEEEYKVDSSPIQDKRNIFTRNFIDNLLRASVKHLPFCGSFLYDVIYGTLDSQKSQKEIKAQSEPGKSQQISTRQKEDINSTKENENWYQTNTFKFVIIPIIVALFLGIPAWIALFGWPKGLEESISTHEPNQETIEISQLVTSLREICQDIDKRPLLQREQTAKSYVGMPVKRESLSLFEITPEEDSFLVLMVFPGESYRPFLDGWGVSFTIRKDDYPELASAKQGLRLHVSGRIEDAGKRYIHLSDVSINLD